LSEKWSNGWALLDYSAVNETIDATRYLFKSVDDSDLRFPGRSSTNELLQRIDPSKGHQSKWCDSIERNGEATTPDPEFPDEKPSAVSCSFFDIARSHNWYLLFREVQVAGRLVEDVGNAIYSGSL
jgi:hypothetical protein